VRTPRGGSGTVHGLFPQVELLKSQKNGQYPDEPAKIKDTNSLCKHPDILSIGSIKEIALEGRLL
jgi:hypothetical protein